IASIAPMSETPAPDAMLAGCGMGNTASAAAVIIELLSTARCPLILDADALNVIAGHLDSGADTGARSRGLKALKNAEAQVTLTPHAGEMARLCGLTARDVNQDIAKAFASEYNCVVVLKGHVPAVAASGGGGLYVNNAAGNPGLARGGSGDVLAGIVAALTARGMDPPIAAACGVWLHAAAADLAARELGQTGMLPSDLPMYLAKLFGRLGL
ncbi:MAG: NAD(P)H-hydrate dehydratase, partial [Oscillospiraceae bacterium]|nr:NAD(P)H-hydrate dehydratase [Oscillospiraceae bacterium]